MLAAAWDVAVSKPKEILVYNFVTHKNNTITYKELLDIGWNAIVEYPSVKTAWYYTFKMVENPIQFKILHFFYHLLPAYFIDLVMILIGQKFRMRRIYDRVEKLTKVFEYFMFTTFDWNHKNVSNLLKRLPESDQEWLDFDMEQVEWRTYYYNSIKGIRQYLIRDPIETLPAAREKQRRLRIAHLIVTWGFKALMFYLGVTLLYVLFGMMLR